MCADQEVYVLMLSNFTKALCYTRSVKYQNSNLAIASTEWILPLLWNRQIIEGWKLITQQNNIYKSKPGITCKNV